LDAFIAALAIIGHINRTLKMGYSYERTDIREALITNLLKKIIN
jgi:hypothetical protein